MTVLINNPSLEERLIAIRQEAGIDKFDEVWEGVYMMSPLANNEHQDLVTELSTILTTVVRWTGIGNAYAGVNVTDQADDWEHNYRCPDVAVFLRETKAQDCGTHWYGGPDLAIEIVSPNDQTFEKLDFYTNIRTREVLIVDRSPWRLILFRFQENVLVEVGTSTVVDNNRLSSEIVPLDWRLVAGDVRPQIEITHQDDTQKWLV